MSRFKTELCNNLIELGSCKYGDRCHYAHGITELRQVSKRHPKYRTESCKNFELTGKCPFGPRCSYVHPKPDLDSMIEQLSKYMKHTKAPKPEDSDDDSNQLSLFTTATSATEISSSTTSSLDNYRLLPKQIDHNIQVHEQFLKPNSLTRCGSSFDYLHARDPMNHSCAHVQSNSSCFKLNEENKENIEMIWSSAYTDPFKTTSNFNNKLDSFQRISPNILDSHYKENSPQVIFNKNPVNTIINSNNFVATTPQFNIEPISLQARQISNRTPLSSKTGNSFISSTTSSANNSENNLNFRGHPFLINNSLGDYLTSSNNDGRNLANSKQYYTGF